MANVGIITQYSENTVWSDITDVYIVNTVKITNVLKMYYYYQLIN